MILRKDGGVRAKQGGGLIMDGQEALHLTECRWGVEGPGDKAARRCPSSSLPSKTAALTVATGCAPCGDQSTRRFLAMRALAISLTKPQHAMSKPPFLFDVVDCNRRAPHGCIARATVRPCAFGECASRCRCQGHARSVAVTVEVPGGLQSGASADRTDAVACSGPRRCEILGRRLEAIGQIDSLHTNYRQDLALRWDRLPPHVGISTTHAEPRIDS